MQGLGVQGGFRIGGGANPFLDLLPPSGLPFIGNPLPWPAIVTASSLRVVLVAAMLCVGVITRAATTTYTGVYAGGTIAPGNTVQSTQIANVRVEQRGRGQQAEAQSMGWLSRFFMTVLPI